MSEREVVSHDSRSPGSFSNTLGGEDIQRLLSEIDDLVHDVCRLRTQQPPRLKKLAEEANKLRLQQMFSKKLHVYVSSHKPNYEEKVGSVVKGLYDCEKRNNRMNTLTSRLKQVQSSSIEQDEILNAITTLINVELAPIGIP